MDKSTRERVILICLGIILILPIFLNFFPQNMRDKSDFGDNKDSLLSLANGDDIYEDNDDFNNATPISAGYYSNLMAADEDWYNLSVRADERISISILFTHVNGDLDLDLYDSSQTLLVSSITATDNETIYFDVATSGNYYIRVYYGINPLYDMVIDITLDPILIDDSNPSLNWSYSASNYNWVSGSGTWGDPYIIKNVTVNAGGSGNGIEIKNSIVPFKIINSTAYNSGSGYAGIKLDDVMNGKLINNTFSYNHWDGILLVDSSNNTLYDNRAHNNDANGIHLEVSSGVCEQNIIRDNRAYFNGFNGIEVRSSDNNTIFDNMAKQNSEAGIYISQGGSYNNISHNIVQNNLQQGIYLSGSNENIVERNNITDTGVGIDVYGSNFNNITGNYVNGNDFWGIYVREGSYNVIVSENEVISNGNYGIEIHASSYDNLIFNNIFNGNGINALDDGTSNFWDNGTIGNYYSDYGGVDADDDGMGDTSHTILGVTGSKDRYPIWDDGHNGTPIFIDGAATGVGAHNWTWAQSKTWCSGSGTWNDPYIIENISIDSGWSGSGIEIQNSDVFFIIRNSSFYYSGSGASDAGIKLLASNGKIINNTCFNNGYWGIGIYSSNISISKNLVKNNKWGIGIFSGNNSVIENIAQNNSEDGIYINADNIIVKNNSLKYNDWYGIKIAAGSNHKITSNHIRNNGMHGLFLQQTQNTIVSNNSVLYNTVYGIHIDLSNNNNISNNKIINNIVTGINFEGSNNNVVSENLIIDNGNYGIEIWSDCFVNLIFSNDFSGNSVNARDNGINNGWDNSLIGNNWFDYLGKDIDDDGIGDSAYNISGTAGSRDNYPIWWDSPIISIISPNTSEIFDGTPQFNFSIDEGIVNTTWYSLDGGLTNITFTGLTGYIYQTQWNKRVDGLVTIKFSVNDSRGYIDFAEVTVLKESIPQITIDSPTFNEILGFNAPEFNITVNDLSPINTTWYTIDGGLTNYTFSGLTGFINQTAWEQEVDGVITIMFYLNDSLGYLGFKDINITKDSTIPKITINSPGTNQLYGSTAPSFSLNIVELNLLEKRYSLNGRPNITFTTEIQFSQSEWNNVGNDTVIIKFYIIDIAGNINLSEVIVRKDIYVPQVTIISPIEDGIFENIAPSFTVDIQDGNLDKMWYTLNNGSLKVPFTSNDTVDQGLWDTLLDGVVTLTFFANDTVGNINFTSVNILKDTLPPEILILSPNLNDIFGINAPTFELSINESNLESTWYTIDGGATNYTFVGSTGTINQAAWELQGNGTVLIRFYANDSIGNIAYLEIIIPKDILAPIITIINPTTNQLFGIGAPSYALTITKGNLDKLWYTLDNGINNITITELTEMINQDLWEKMPNGYISIKFYVNDTLGNIGFNEVIIVKDTPTSNSPPGGIPGYNTFLLIGIIFVVSVILIKKRNKIKE
ncbi:hypothetical protein LCGC14_0720300 [marine sediment metagenome]|uniref:Carbohydrate-binding/sugar hydrolysis domain-containing protein n=1 Tax=marine sediment metagenome TaxID=412755 RepID=A0A0F9SXY7_9ZZZZ|nr:hypothetical protein [bacterium]